MGYTIKHWLLALCLAVGLSSAFAQTAEQLVQNMGQAFREHNYRGYLSYEYGAKNESFALVHGVIDGLEYEKINTLSGPASEIVRTGHELSCLHPGNNLLRYGLASSANAQAADLAPVPTLDSYDFHLMGNNRVAGRDVFDIQVIPRDAMRNGFNLSIDQATGLMLKTVIISPEAKVLERFQFIHIDFDTPITASEFDGATAIAVRKVAHGEGRVLKQALTVSPRVEASPAWLPSGFLLAEEDHHHQASSLMLYSDGLATVSVLVEQVTANTVSLNTDGHARRGSMVAYTRPVLVDGQKYVLTVMGEVPMLTAAKIARHMKFRRAG